MAFSRSTTSTPNQNCTTNIDNLLKSNGNTRRPYKSCLRTNKLCSKPTVERASTTAAMDKSILAHTLNNKVKIDKTMLGYDWIAGMLDNDSFTQSEEFFEELKTFRRQNRDECKAELPIERKKTTTKDKVTFRPEKTQTEEKENLPLCCTGSAYMVNNRLQLLPVHGPYSECPVCKTKPQNHPEDHIRVSIPLEKCHTTYKVKSHRRKSFDPSDSVALSMHCLTGWQNSRPSFAVGPTSVDLRSHASVKTKGLKTNKFR